MSETGAGNSTALTVTVQAEVWGVPYQGPDNSPYGLGISPYS
jgi:hypothetical protein